MLKAAAGGGGKGMRLVASARELEPRSARARAREAKSAFGDERVYLEKALERPRHIEIQVLADAHGNAVHLFERECSIQRRHQKVVEESPSPFVTPELRERMGALALALVRRVGLPERGHARVPGRRRRHALLPGDEHAAPGGAPGDRDGDRRRPGAAADPDRRGRAAAVSRRPTSRQRGHAIECRVYAEDPDAGLPAEPRTDPRAARRRAAPACATTRASTRAARCRSTTTRSLSKLVAWAESRRGGDRADAARGRASTGVLGDPHDAAVLRARAEPSRLREGRARHRLRAAAAGGSRGRASRRSTSAIAAAAIAAYEERRRGAASCAGAARAASAWSAAGRREAHADRLGTRRMIFDASVPGRAVRVEVRGGGGPLRGRARRPGARGAASAASAPASMSLLIGTTSHELGLEREADGYRVAFRGGSVLVSAGAAARGGAAAVAPRAAGPARLTAPMPGPHRARAGCGGAEVAAGQGLVVIEAMKMENELRAPRGGRLARAAGPRGPGGRGRGAPGGGRLGAPARTLSRRRKLLLVALVLGATTLYALWRAPEWGRTSSRRRSRARSSAR